MKAISASIVTFAGALVICLYYIFTIKSEALPLFGILLTAIGLAVFIHESGLVGIIKSVVIHPGNPRSHMQSNNAGDR